MRHVKDKLRERFDRPHLKAPSRRRNEKLSLIRFFTGMTLGPVDELQSNIDIAKQS